MKPNKAICVRFTADDIAGLWREGDLAEDLGWESGHPDAPPIRLFRPYTTGEVIALTNPFERGLCAPVDQS